MKKLIITIVLALQFVFAFAQSPTLTKIDEKNIKLGNKYFYAFEGAKWEWTLDLLGNKSTFSWTVSGVYKITDSKNGLTNKLGLQTQCKQLGTTWYFIEHDGFLCKYENSDGVYTITKFIPLNPKIGIKWIANTRQNIVTSVTDDFVKIEVEDDKKATSGYKLFRKNVGLYDLFEIEKNTKGQTTTKWTLKTYIPPKIDTPATTTTSTTTTTVAPSQNTASMTVTTTSTTTTTTTTTTVKPLAPVTYLESLPPKTDIIQVGSFSQQEFAEDSCRKCMDKGYNTVIFKEKGLFKVLIIPGDTPDIIKKIKDNLGIDGFYKQRK